MVIETDRLFLRRWQPGDGEPFVHLNADPRVMEFFPAPLSRAETEAMITEIERRIDRDGFGLWAAELKAGKEFIGFIGLNVPGYQLPFSPCVEIGWRLAFDHWGKGYAQEGARAALTFGFESVGLKEIVSFTTVANLRSRHVMEKIGMVYDKGADFDHPNLPEAHPLRRHVLYRKLADQQWRTGLIGGIEKREIKIVEYDSDWSNRFAKHAEIIADAIGSSLVRIEHIGSTSVSGLAAKSIVDILVVVPDSTDEGAYLPPLEAAGYVLRVREPDWNEHRMFRNPEKDVHIHVYSVGCPEIQRNLIFRNRLRENAEDRRRYEQTKRELAARSWPDMNAYAEAKTKVIESIIAAARAAGEVSG